MAGPTGDGIVPLLVGELTNDVVIAGGGLAGLCLAIHLKRTDPAVSVLVLDRRTHPAPEAAFKVGESSVEIGSQYFRNVLGLADLLEDEVPKFGLRFFFSDEDNQDVAKRFEFGPSRFLHVPSYQIDRGQFENALVLRARSLGAEVRFDTPVREIDLGTDGARHKISFGDAEHVDCRWFVDAAGRAGLLKRTLGLTQKNGHDVNAAWFRVDHAIDIDAFSSNAAYRDRVQQPRRLSTNHLMGDGYWVWIIPLAKERTSIGIVADESRHAFTQMNTFERAFDWLERHEPQLADFVRPHLDRRLDSLVLKHFSYASKQLFSGDRWCMTGEAGVFADPLYSPGSDFIGISNELIVDLISRDRAGEDISKLAEVHERTYAGLYRTMMTIYQRQYPIMGNARVMSLKLIWDFAMYWGGIAMIAQRAKMSDPAFMARIQDNLLAFAGLGFGMQRFLRRWDELDPSRSSAPRGFVDYATISFLERLNRRLLEDLDDDAIVAQHDENLQLARDLDCEIRSVGAATLEGLRPKTMDLAAPKTNYLGPTLSTLFEGP